MARPKHSQPFVAYPNSTNTLNIIKPHHSVSLLPTYDIAGSSSMGYSPSDCSAMEMPQELKPLPYNTHGNTLPFLSLSKLSNI